MFNSLPMVLIADQDSFSNTALSYGLRKLGLARNVICTTSASNALAYLQKQQICSYPFPEFILYNPANLKIEAKEFLGSFKSRFSHQYDSKIILLREKDQKVDQSTQADESLVLGGLYKPICSEQLLRLFGNRNKNSVYR